MKKIFHPVGHTLYSSVCNIFIFSISGFLCLYVGLKVPYETGFDQVKGSTHQAFSDCALNQLLVPGYQQVFAWTDLLIDFAFSFDLLINFFTGTHSQKYSIFLFFDYCLSVDLLIDFFTARWIVDSEGREHWRLVEDLYTIRQMYMFRCPENGFTLLPLFWLDIVGIIPWQYVDCLHASFQVLKNLRVFRLVEF